MKIFIDYKRAMAEGRFSQDFIDEMREEANFDVLYECKFPDENELDLEGYRVLVKSDDYYASLVDQKPSEKELAQSIAEKELILGLDIGGGSDSNVFVIRSPRLNIAWCEHHEVNPDPLSVVPIAIKMAQKYGIRPENIIPDAVGIGQPVVARFKELGWDVTAFRSGSTPRDRIRYRNMRAQAYWGMRTWINKGGKLVKHQRFAEVLGIKWKESSEKLIAIQPKEELKAKTGKSPDFADALMQTFSPTKPKAKVYKKKASAF